MSLDRDELAARFAVALIHSGQPKHAHMMSEIAVGLADALLSALVPVAPASGAPAPLPGAPLAAPSPAATPAAWVPSVGDVVKHVSESDETALKGQIRVVVSTSPLRLVYVEDGRTGGSHEPRGWVDDVRFVRRATSSERAAAGLPVDESATKPVDREGLAGAIWRSFNDESPDRRFDTIGVYERESYIHAADAAIAFMAKGGAS